MSAAAVLAANTASAVTFTFGNISNNGPQDVASQLSVEVTDGGVLLGVQYVDFKFLNVGAIASSITEIYFDDGTLLGAPSITNGAGTSFVHNDPLTPPDLPGGAGLIPPFVATSTFGAENSPNPPVNGVNPGENVTLRFALVNGKTFADTIAAIQLGNTDRSAADSLSIGLHVRAIGTAGNSDSFVTVPEPTGVLLFGIGTLIAGAAVRRRR